LMLWGGAGLHDVIKWRSVIAYQDGLRGCGGRSEAGCRSSRPLLMLCTGRCCKHVGRTHQRASSPYLSSGAERMLMPGKGREERERGKREGEEGGREGRREGGQCR